MSIIVHRVQFSSLLLICFEVLFQVKGTFLTLHYIYLPNNWKIHKSKQISELVFRIEKKIVFFKLSSDPNLNQVFIA